MLSMMLYHYSIHHYNHRKHEIHECFSASLHNFCNKKQGINSNFEKLKKVVWNYMFKYTSIPLTALKEALN